MNLGRTLAGAVVGAAVGVALHLALVAVAHVEAAWFAIAIGWLTGLGVRQSNKALVGMVSYPSGALSAVVALVAIIVGSLFLVPIVITTTTPKQASVGVPLEEQTPPMDAEPPGEPKAAEEPGSEPKAAEEPGSKPKAAEEPGSEPKAGDEPAGEPADRPARPAVRPESAARSDEATTRSFLDFFDIWHFLFVAVGTFLAYENGRGTRGKAPAAPSA